MKTFDIEEASSKDLWFAVLGEPPQENETPLGMYEFDAVQEGEWKCE